MRVFVLAAESGSFSATGRHIGVVPSSVSRQILALEETLGARLFNRTPRGLSLTEAGELYKGLAAGIIAPVDDAARQMELISRHPRGTIRLHAPRAFGRLVIAPALAGFLERHESLHIDLTLDDSLEDIVASRGDLFIRIGSPRSSSLVGRRLMANHRVLCASPQYLERDGVPIRPDDLRQHACMTYRFPNGNSTWLLRRNRTITRVSVRGPLIANDGEALLAAALQGSGIILQPSWLVASDLRAGRLVRLLSDYAVTATAFDTTIHALYPSRRLLSPKVRLLLDYLLNHLAVLVESLRLMRN
jgi:DNA-binding transcriptional LysR family regulator